MGVYMRSLVSILAISTFLTFSGAASAQSTGTPEAAPAGETPAAGDIVVTGTRRAARLQDVAVSITAISDEALKQAGYKSANELQYAVPGLTYNPQLGAGFLIRGIGTQGFDYSLERAVGVVIDDVVQGQPRNLGFNTFGDIDHIEVLKGPQGTLFGKNASAGVVYVVTKKPEMGVHSTAGSIMYGERNELRIDNTVNVPITDNLAARVTGVYQRQDGYLKNLYDNSTGGDYRDYAVRGKLLWQPTDDLEVYVIGAIQDHKDGGLGGLATFRSLAPYTTTGWPTNPDQHSIVDFPALLAQDGIKIGSKNTEYSHNSLDEVYVKQRDIQANVKLALGDFTLTSVTAYSHSKTGSWFDQDYTQSNFYDINNSALRSHQLSQEIRLNSPVGGFVDYVVGAFAWDQKTTAYERSAGKRGYDDVYPEDTYFSFSGAMSNYKAHIRSYALFGEANFHFTDKLTATGGLRLTHDKVFGAYFPSADIDYTFLGTPAPAKAGTKKGSNLSGKITLKYEPGNDMMFYATYSRGYKAPAVGTSGGNLRMVKAENVDNFELGARTQLFDRLVTINATLFYEKFKNFQSTVVELGDDGISRSVLSNAPGLVTKGVEADVNVRPMADLTFGASVSYAPTEYQDFLAPCYSGQAVVAAADRAPGRCFRYGTGTALDVDGFDSIQAPKTTFTVNAAFNPMITEKARLFMNATYYHRSSVYSQAGNPNSIVPSYGLVNANIGVGNEDGSIKLTLYARNLFDKMFVSRLNTITFAPAGSYQQYFSGEGARTIGARFDYSF
jgi:iron complex outermembrane receptor protein